MIKAEIIGELTKYVTGKNGFMFVCTFSEVYLKNLYLMNILSAGLLYFT